MSLFEEDIDITENNDLGLDDPKSMSFCVGHDNHESLFLNLFQNDVFPHALIFSGIMGIGKTTMAFRLARFLLKHGKSEDAGLFADALPQDFNSLHVDSDDPIFSRIASGGHADLLHIARGYNSSTNKHDSSLKVDTLRQIEPFLRKTSSEGGWRIVIVEDADTMNRNAQNAILKILEEPPEKVLIILIAHSSGSLIPTIRSRARLIEFSSLSQDNINSLLQKKNIELSAHDLNLVTAISQGSIGKTLGIIEDDGLSMIKTILDHLNADGAKTHSLANSLATASQDKQYRLFTSLVCWIFRQLLFIKARGETNLPQYLDHESLQNIFQRYSLENLIELSDSLQAHFDRIEFSNLDRRDAIRSAFLMIENEGNIS